MLLFVRMDFTSITAITSCTIHRSLLLPPTGHYHSGVPQLRLMQSSHCHLTRNLYSSCKHRSVVQHYLPLNVRFVRDTCLRYHDSLLLSCASTLPIQSLRQWDILIAVVRVWTLLRRRLYSMSHLPLSTAHKPMTMILKIYQTNQAQYSTTTLPSTPSYFTPPTSMLQAVIRSPPLELDIYII